MNGNSFYSGMKGTLRFVADILDDYDGAKSVKTLKELIVETRENLANGLKEEGDLKDKLQSVFDISNGYDDIDTIEGLKQLIDKMRAEAIKGIKES